MSEQGQGTYPKPLEIKETDFSSGEVIVNKPYKRTTIEVNKVKQAPTKYVLGEQ